MAPTNGLGTACIGSMARATNVACDSVTASSMDTPEPSLRISTPRILAAHRAPYSLAPDRVTLNGSTWSEYQGMARSLRPERSVTWVSSWLTVAPTDRPVSRTMELVNRALASGASWVWYWGRISSVSATK